MKHTSGPWVVEAPMGFELSIVEAHKPAAEWRFIAHLALPEKDEEEPDFAKAEVEANAQLIAAAPDLYEACTYGTEANLPDFLEWIADRFVHVYGENPTAHFVLSCHERVKKLKNALAKANGEA